MRINYNVSAMIANNSLANNDNALAKSLERLSSGLKVNNAKDNPAGLAMAKRMNAQLQGLGVANQNSRDGVSVIETADGALESIQQMLQRMTELATQAANGTLVDDDRKIIQDEMEQLKEEIQRVSKTTEFNGQPLLDGTYDLRAYTNQEDYKVTTYTSDVPENVYTSLDLSWSVDADGIAVVNINGLSSEYPGSTDGAGNPINPTTAGYKATLCDDVITMTGPDGFEIRISIPENEGMVPDSLNPGKYIPTAGNFTNLSIDATKLGAMRLQVGANEGQVLPVEIPAVSLQNLGLKGLDVSTEVGARNAMGRLDEASAFVSKVRGRLGAYQNRLETTENTLDITSENMTGAYSRIMDVDMAEEMTQYSTYTVLQQAGISILAQANDRPSQVLQLLQ